MGRPAGSNSVSVVVASGATNILRRSIRIPTLEEEAVNSLHRIASHIRANNANGFACYYEGTPGVLLISRAVARQLADLGWTRQSIQQFLWEHSSLSMDELKRTGLLEYVERDGLTATLRDPWPITAKPENIAIVVAGGGHPTHAFWMQAAQSPKLAGAPISLPAGWSDLMDEAERDLGGGEVD